MNTTDRQSVVKCLTDMLQLLEPDAMSSVAASLSFQKSVTSWKDAVQSLPPPRNGTWRPLANYAVKAGVVYLQVKLCDPHLSALEVRFSRRGAIRF